MSDLYPTFRFGDIDLAGYPYSVVFGYDRGTAEGVVASVTSALRDGSISRVTRYENRTVTIPVLIEGPTLAHLADHEAALVAEVLKERNEFTFNPGDGFAVDSVYDTFAASLVPEYDDELERQGYRRFELSFEARPWPRSADKVVTAAVVTDAPTVEDSGSSATNWSAPYGPTGAAVSVSSGAVRSTYDPSLTMASGFYGASLRRTAVVDVSTSKYVALDWKTSKPSYFALQTNATVGNLAEVRREPAPTSGFTRSWFQIPDTVTSLAWLQFGIVHPPQPTGAATLDIDQVLLANALPASGTARQLTRTITPGGSVPAEGDIIVEHPTAGLGHAIVYSHPVMGGYSPPLRQWLHSSSAPTASPSNTYSGAYHDLGTTTLYLIPTEAIPEGDVQLWARVQRSVTSTTLNISWKAQSGLASGANVGDSQQGSTSVYLPVDTWVFVPLARLTLPVSRINSGKLGIEISIPTSSVILDEAWLFAMDKGRLTVVQCGDGTPATGVVNNRLRISAPSPEQPNGSIMIGTAADFSDAFVPPAANILCDQTGHRFDPAGSMIFTGVNVPDAAVSLEHYPRWHSNAAT